MYYYFLNYLFYFLISSIFKKLLILTFPFYEQYINYGLNVSLYKDTLLTNYEIKAFTNELLPLET